MSSGHVLRVAAADDLRRVLGGCAVAGPVLVVAASLVAWSVQDVYSPRREDISALAAIDAQHALIMIAGIIALGLSLIALGLGLVGVIDDGHSATVGPVLLVLAGVSFTGAGLARNDCSSELQACKDSVSSGDVSWHHNMHDLLGVVVFLVLAVAPLVFARAFRADSRWSELRRYSLLSGALTLALLVVFGAELFAGWNGLVQRVLILVPLVWIAVLGAHLVKIAGAGRRGSARFGMERDLIDAGPGERDLPSWP
jgi:hypothetical membrane protein